MWNHWDDYDFWAEDNGIPPDAEDVSSDWEDFAFIGGLFGLIEEEDEEERRLRKEMDENWDEPLDD